MIGKLVRVVGLGLLLVGVLAPEARAQEVRVFQQRPFLRSHRLELAPISGLSINDPMVQHVSLGGTLYYHFTESVAGGVSYWRTIASETSLYDKVQTDYSVLPSILKTDSLITAQASYAFLYGKFALFNTWVVHYDTTFQGGVGVSQTRAGNNDLAFDYGIGQRYFLLDWLSLNLEARHYIINDDSLFHNITVAAGVGFFVPFHTEYKNPK